MLVDEAPDLVMVPGDVNSTLAAALTAVKMGIPVAHIEPGLRSFDRTMPEEINRIVADEVSEHLFLHSDEAVENLRAEGVAERAHALRRQHDDRHAGRPRGPLPRRGDPRATGGRAGRLRAGHPAPSRPGRRTAAAGDRPPARRPRPADAGRLPGPPPYPQDDGGGRLRPPGPALIEPLGYLDFLSLVADAGAVLTDSGGIQEETTYLGVPCFTLRDNTERPVTIRVGTNTLLGLDPAAIAGIPAALAARSPERPPPPPLWDGKASERIADVVEKL